MLSSRFLSLSAAPFFIKQIIEALGDPTPEKISKAYVLAGLALLASLAKGQTDLNKVSANEEQMAEVATAEKLIPSSSQLWRGRRAAIRVNTQIAGAIFSKALVRQDASGVGEGKGASGVGKIVSCLLLLLFPHFPSFKDAVYLLNSLLFLSTLPDAVRTNGDELAFVSRRRVDLLSP